MSRGRCLLGGFILMLSAGYMCVPLRRDLFDIDCDKDLNCTDVEKLVCGSDGVTYTNLCYLEVETQRQNCVIGNFNPIVVVKDGNCTEDGDGVRIDNTMIIYNNSP
ncbi:serine protease inhibitor Kazal-type 4-like [Mercenaria mercenaria]|uniref:serine protease inhibitor Kazal-type 4-like n=1 Tax=Mercenaria mercenaria TaxID=6596 RepID=UPI001E1DA457|nr:serine protease inhibitor Kazal-type 4-like [Mercenaria mercenaria]